MLGESLFLRKIFPGILLEKSAKITRPPMPSAAPIRPASLVSTQQGVETSLRNDLTPFRKAYIFTALDKSPLRGHAHTEKMIRLILKKRMAQLCAGSSVMTDWRAEKPGKP